MATHVSGVAFLLDDLGRLVGYLDGQGRERGMDGADLPPGVDVLPIGDSTLLGWAQTQNFQLVSGTRDANGALTAAQIAWPDGTAGVFTADVLSTAFPGAIDAWHATYVGDTTKTVTQPAVTRDANGAVTAQPAILIS